MQLYHCPNCGAEEGAAHRTACSLAGHMVELKYDPPAYGRAERWLHERRAELEMQYPGRYIVLNIVDLSFATGINQEDAFLQYKSQREGAQRFTPPTGRHFLCTQLF